MQIKKALESFEKVLLQNLPNVKESKSGLARKLAIIHCEFNAIHPFREGNGRSIRLFLDLMAVRCGFSVIDYGNKDVWDFVEYWI